MALNVNKMPTPLARLVLSAQTQPKKAALVALLAVVMVLLLIDGLSGKAPTPPLTIRASDAPAEAFQPMPISGALSDEYIAGIDRQMGRNPFTLDYDAYPRLDGESAAVASAGDGLLERLRLALTADARQAQLQQQRTREIQRDAAALSVQSLFAGPSPTAIINGQLLTVGQSVDGFVIEQIGAGRCVVARQGVRVVIETQQR